MRRQGFNLAELVLCAVMLGAIAIGAWFAWNHYIAAPDTQTRALQEMTIELRGIRKALEAQHPPVEAGR